MRTLVTGVLAAAAFAVPLVAAADSKTFTAPSGWVHQPSATSSPGAVARSLDTWKKGNQSLTVLFDAGLAYADELALVRKNISENGLHPTTDRDFTCAGRPAHEVLMSLNGSMFRQVLIDDGAGQGSTRITYSHPDSVPAAPDVDSAITAYCGP